MNNKVWIWVAWFSLVFSMAQAQILNPAKWQYKVSKEQVKINETVEIVFQVILDEGWHLYGNIQNYDMGPMPTEFSFETQPKYKIVGTVKPVGAKSEFDTVFDVTVNYFEGKATFSQTVKILDSNPIIKGTYEYQVCHMTQGKCILLSDDFEIKIKTTP